nr:polh/gran [Apis mellifera nudivirus]
MNGARSILVHIPAGLYVRTPKSYNIYVDGELIRYKGMVTENLTKTDAELAIARTSFLYLRKLLESVEMHLHKRSSRTIVYMDGARVANKVADRPEFMFDASLIRSTFSAYCLDNGIEMRHLEYGESELQMYLMRDTMAELNVFITADSDALAIMYHHRAVENKEAESEQGEELNRLSETIATVTTTNANIIEADRIVDRNMNYKEAERVRDSCLWISCASSGIVAYGMDGLRDRLGYAPFAFRVFLALCGTDFTPQLYTDSMIAGIMTATRSDREFINMLTDVNELAALFLLLGLRGNGTIKRKEAYNFEHLDSSELIGWIDNLDRLVRNYITYTESGRMNPDPIAKPKMSILCRYYLFSMRNGVDIYVRKNIQIWAKDESLENALANFRKMIKKERMRMGKSLDCTFKLSLQLAENRFGAQKRHKRLAGGGSGGGDDNDNDDNDPDDNEHKKTKRIAMAKREIINQVQNAHIKEHIANLRKHFD